MDSNATPAATDALHGHQVVLLAVAALAELRESDTEGHLLRVRSYVRLLALKLQSHPVLGPQISNADIETMCSCVPMYDLGSVAVPDRILLKPGKLTEMELAIMKSHPLKGFDAIARAEKTLGVTSPLLAVAKEMTLSHHEKWNGKGYPKGLSGTQIPLSARILAVADVYDALICNKVYRQGLSHEKAAGIILSERGEHFDPDVVDAFSDLSRDFEAVAHKFADTEQDMQNKIEYMADAIAEIAEF
jgi:putative two-component system response regulator